MSRAVDQTSSILVELKERASSLLTISFKRSKAVLNATGGVIVNAEAMSNPASV